MKNRVLLVVLFVCSAFTLWADAQTSPKKRISVNNRVLASVNGKVISVIDVMKKMDMVLYQNYPQYLDVPEARFEYYKQHWREMLSDLVDRELILADADEKGFPVSSGDVREELEEIFGPDVMLNLDNADLTLDEAWQMVKADILIRRMLYYQVRMQVYPLVTPKEIRKVYEERIKNLSGQKECIWQCLTLKSTSTNRALEHAQAIHELLTGQNVAMSDIEAELEKRALEKPELAKPDVQLIVSQEFRQKQAELSQNLQDLLLTMQPGTFSTPQVQSSRSEQNPVVRIYYVKEIRADTVPLLAEMEPELRDEITQRLVAEKTVEYFQELRRHFHLAKDQIERDLPPNFQPFELK